MKKPIKNAFTVLLALSAVFTILKISSGWVFSWWSPRVDLSVSGDFGPWRPFPPRSQAVNKYRNKIHSIASDEFVNDVLNRKDFYVSWSVPDTYPYDLKDIEEKSRNAKNKTLKDFADIILKQEKIFKKDKKEIPQKILSEAFDFVVYKVRYEEIYPPHGYWDLIIKNEGRVPAKSVFLKINDARYAIIRPGSPTEVDVANNRLDQGVQIGSVRNKGKVEVQVWTSTPPTRFDLDSIALTYSNGVGENLIDIPVSRTARFIGENWFLIIQTVLFVGWICLVGFWLLQAWYKSANKKPVR